MRQFFFVRECCLFGQSTFEHDAELAIDCAPVTNRHGPFPRSFKRGQLQDLEVSASQFMYQLFMACGFLGFPFFGYAVSYFSTLRLLRSIEDSLQVGSKLFTVLVRHVLERIANLAHKATLVFRFWEGDGNGLLNAGQSIGADDEYILDAMVLPFA